MKVKVTIKHVFYILEALCLTITCCYAQSSKEWPQITVQREMSVHPGINSLDLSISASQVEGFKGSVRLALPQGADVLGRELIPLEIGESQVRYFSIKFRMAGLHLAQDKEAILELMDSTGRIRESVGIRLTVPSRRLVRMANETLFQYIRQVGDSIETRVRVSNLGTRREVVKIVYSSDDRIGKAEFLESTIELDPGEDTLIRRSIIVERYILQRSQYTVNVSGMYQNSDLVDNISLVFTSLSSHRDFARMFPSDASRAWQTPNFMELQADNLASPLPTYHLRAQGDYTLMGSRTHFGAMMYHVNGMSRPVISNTYMEMALGGHVLTLGNIQESLEMPVYGSGVRYSHRDTSKTISYTLALLERSSDLLAGLYGQGLGHAAYAKFEKWVRPAGRMAYQAEVVMERNDLDSTRSLLVYNQFDLLAARAPRGASLKGRLGFGLHGLQGEGEGRRHFIPSAAGGLNFTWQPGKWQLNSEGFYSSPYYPGNRRGTLQVMNRLSRNWRKANLSLDQTFMDQNPSYLSLNSFLYHQRSSRISASVFAPLTPRMNIGLVPRLLSEQTRLQTALGESILQTRSMGLLFSGNLRSSDLRHQFNFSLENALVDRKGQDQTGWAMRADLGYSYGEFAMNGSYQKGAMQSLDLIGSSSMVGQPDRFSVSARVGGKLLDGRFGWNAGSMAFLSSRNGDSYGVNLDLRYRAMPRTEIQGNLQLSRNSNGRGDAFMYNNLRLGVRQILPYRDPMSPRIKRGNIQVQCFFDSNGNGIFDPDEKPAGSYNFSLGDFLLTTDQQGLSTFSSLPYGTYKLYFPPREQYLAETRILDLDHRNVELRIPLRLGGEVRGRLAIDYVTGISRRVDYELRDIRVLALCDGGRYEMMCDSNGEFRASLPEGTYSIQVDLQSLPADIVHNGKGTEVHLRPGKIAEVPVIHLSVRAKRVEVKRFGTP